MPTQDIKNILESLPRIRQDFEKSIEVICIETIETAKKISGAIGEVSIEEAKIAILNDFRNKLGI